MCWEKEMAYVHPDPGVRLVDSELRTVDVVPCTEYSYDDWIYHAEYGLLVLFLVPSWARCCTEASLPVSVYLWERVSTNDECDRSSQNHLVIIELHCLEGLMV